MEQILIDILWQMFYYFLVCLIMVFCVAMLLRDFFFKYLKVRASFGKYILVKIRNPLRDHFEVGWIEESFLVYKTKIGKKKEIKKLSIPKDATFYRANAVLNIDVDEEKNAICKTDYSVVAGYDAIKFQDLNTRALMRPAIKSNQETIILVLCVLILIAVLIDIYLNYTNSQNMQTLTTAFNTFVSTAKGSIISTGATV